LTSDAATALLWHALVKAVDQDIEVIHGRTFAPADLAIVDGTRLEERGAEAFAQALGLHRPEMRTLWVGGPRPRAGGAQRGALHRRYINGSLSVDDIRGQIEAMLEVQG
jgi:hypothetical protein